MDGGLTTAGSVTVGGADNDHLVGFSAVGVPQGDWVVNIEFTTNEDDPAKAIANVPVTMHVVPGYDVSGKLTYLILP